MKALLKPEPVGVGVQHLGPAAAAWPPGGKTDVAQHAAIPMPRRDDTAVGIDHGIQGTNVHGFAPQLSRLMKRDLLEGSIVKRHHFAAFMVVFMPAILQQAIEHRQVNAALPHAQTCMGREAAGGLGLPLRKNILLVHLFLC